jgi:archaellum component FlaF (FlaF/FlaG flagellin family)
MAVQLTASRSGSTVSVQATNNGSTAQTLRASVRVHLFNGEEETVETNVATVQPGSTVVLYAQASAPVKYVVDGPDPLDV